MDLSKAKVDWNRITVREMAEFRKDVADLERQVAMMTRLYVELPDGQDPADPETWFRMGMADFEAAVEHAVEVKRQGESKS